ncbi:puromycin-sensitive aminopeptidase-like protein [Trypanosoma cruzi marinkellei]|uniref:Puromycin-sensitive aminopeptidase-like protein n=1 Tax=Trypanosoma cruzi marinkellei TaxID=85056 RepID=K2M6F5_TRYCR|nr:puromycin-sensitive aminopeptidase-like protein [Trypanosoma cruzi marinkellei]
MGNWGMVNMHLDYMLVNESTPLERRQRIARLIGHMVAHQWFGYWATASWWNFLWMREGISRCLEFNFVNNVFPDWLIWDEFLTQVLDDALVLDSQPEKTHPVQYCHTHPRLIEDGFDSISFGKGASIMWMLFSLLGGECLRTTTRRLLQRCNNTCFDSQMFLDCLLYGEHVTERREMAAAVVRGAEQSGHPFLYVEEKPDGICCITQYQMPDLRQGILQAYIKLQQGKETTDAMDLMAPRRLRVFTWNAEHFLQRSNYNVYVNIVELQEMGCLVGRTFCMRSSQEIIKCFPGRLLYLNYHGTGVLRCDYDTATWRRIFEVAPFLTSQDRMVITMTLFRFRNIHIGQDSTDRMDRCELLLEWLMYITQSGVMTASQWSYITHQIEYIFYMVRDYPCWELFSKFVCSLYTPLIRRGSLSFTAQEQAVTFESRRDISRTTVLHILQVLAICNCPVILDESREQVERALMSIMPHFTHDFARGTFTTHNSVEFNVLNDFDAVAVSIAMQCLIEHGDMKTWWILACIVAAIFNISLQKTAEELHLDVIKGISVTQMDELHKSRWLNMIAPALFAFDSSSTLPFLLLVLQNFKSLNTPIAKAILRNKRLVTSLFECTSLVQSIPHITVIRHLLIMHGAMLCSDSNLILLMMASVAGETRSERNSTAAAAGACAGGNHSRSKQEVVHTSNKTCSLPVVNAILAMKTNCLWMDYCCDHYDSFLSKRFCEKQLTITPLGTPRASMMDLESMEEDGVST